MPWRSAEFKDKKVWVEVDDQGALNPKRGLVSIRYSRSSGAKVYSGSASKVALDTSAPLETLDAGTASKPSSKSSASKGSGFGKAGTRTDAQKAMAQEAAISLITSFDKSVALCFTDGACKGNPGPAGSGAHLQLPDGRIVEASLALGKATNNIAELKAIDLALTLLEESELAADVEVALFTDSSYSNGVLTRGWKAKANQALIQGIKAGLASRPKVTIYWIAGHVGVDGNERADELANQGVLGKSNTRWR